MFNISLKHFENDPHFRSILVVENHHGHSLPEAPMQLLQLCPSPSHIWFQVSGSDILNGSS